MVSNQPWKERRPQGMSRYRTVHCKIWSDDVFPFLDDDTKLVVLHLLTTPLSTPFGLYKASVGALADEMRWERERYRKAFMKASGKAFAKPFLKYDERHLLCLIPNFLKYNPPGSPNVLKSWSKVYSELPDCALKVEFYDTLKAFLEGYDKAFQKAFTEAFAKPSPTGTGSVTVRNTLSDSGESDRASPRFEKIPFKEIVLYLNQKTGKTFKVASKATISHINARWNEGHRLQDFKQVIDIKAVQWLRSPEMNKYLRPETLFGSKFEAYLNENCGSGNGSGDQSPCSHLNALPPEERTKILDKVAVDNPDFGEGAKLECAERIAAGLGNALAMES
jgi:uncharacterized phage protein (TIGR02220 family)